MIRSSTSCEVAEEANENVLPESEAAVVITTDSSAASTPKTPPLFSDVVFEFVVFLLAVIPALGINGDGGEIECRVLET